MGKLKQTVKPRTCLLCKMTVECTSTELKQHARVCAERIRRVSPTR